MFAYLKHRNRIFFYP